MARRRNSNMRMKMVWTLVLFTVYFTPTLSAHNRPRLPEDIEDTGGNLLGVTATHVEAIVGKSVLLPCDIEPETNQDRLYMVLWFYYSGGKPIYSFDVRGRSFDEALKWSDPDGFNKRADFLAYHQPAVLMITNVDLDDEGYYRCRVDYKNSPTRNVQIRLKVIVPPHKMLLYDDNGRDIGGLIGPLEEGGGFHVNCEVRGGRPRPFLRWLFNGEPIEDSKYIRNDDQAIVSRIEMDNADRSWRNSTIICQAINTEVYSPHERVAKIDMHLRPTSVEISKKPLVVKDEEPLSLECVAKGSRPHARITWYKENTPLRFGFGKQTLYENETTTVSRVTIIPTPADDGARFRCVAENVLLNAEVEDSFVLAVEYKPVVTINLGSTLTGKIKEGEDVYLDCNIKAQPKEYRVNWFRNDIPITLGSVSNVFISNKSLIIQKVTREHAGLYSCAAVNRIGSTVSAHFFLNIQYKPLCIQTGWFITGVTADVVTVVKCVVEANPTNLTFYWTFNSTSGHFFEISSARFETIVTEQGTTSLLYYIASGESDLGFVSCWANNSIGFMINPCVFKIIRATPPEPPNECTLLKVERKSEPYLAVHCNVGFNGGLKQHFTLQITGEAQPVTLVNTTAVTKEGPTIWLNVTWSAFDGLLPHQNLVVTALNSKGTSATVVLKNDTFLDAYRWPERVEEPRSTVPLYAVLIALVVLLALAALTTVMVYRSQQHAASAVAVVVDSKRPSQSVVQIDSDGRRCIAAYPTANDQEPTPDVLYPKSDISSPAPRPPPRVVLESEDGESYMLRELAPDEERPFPINTRDRFPQR